MITATDLIMQARTWLGVPFRHQGRSRVGVDCAGLIVAVLRETGALPPHFRDLRWYGRAPSGELREMIERYCIRIDRPEPAALVLIRWPKSRDASHVALCTGETLIHCYAAAKRVIEHGYREPWLSYTDSAYRLPGVLYE